MEEGKTTYQAAQVYKSKSLAAKYDYTRFYETAKKRRRDLSTQRAIIEVLRRLDECEKLLDMPCGTGRLTKLLLDAGYSYIGSDIAGEMIEVAREKVDTVPFLQASGENLPFKDDSVDCIVCVRFLGRIPPGPRLQILKELCRISKRYMLAAAGYFGPPRPVIDGIHSSLPWLFRKGAKRVARHTVLRQELEEAGWSIHFWHRYKSCGFFSTTKTIAVFMKNNRNGMTRMSA